MYIHLLFDTEYPRIFAIVFKNECLFIVRCVRMHHFKKGKDFLRSFKYQQIEICCLAVAKGNQGFHEGKLRNSNGLKLEFISLLLRRPL